MPFTVSCAACDSRFLLGDDLFRRKVSGKVVTVKCRNCNAEISVDATEPATLPSQEPPLRRAHPAPPRPKHKDGDAATGTPLPVRGLPAAATPLPAAATPLPGKRLPATGTPLPKPTSATQTPLPAGALLSIWDAAEKSVEAPRKGPPPRPHAAARPRAQEPELIEDIEEAPPSSSDAPTLNALTHETSPRQQTNSKKKKAPDDFLVNLSTGTGGILGAPTIDVMGLASPPPPAVEELLEIEATELTPRAGTVPLFDMSAVLPVASSEAKSLGSSLSPSNLDLAVDVEMPQTPSESGKPRERKYVVAPKTKEDAPAPKTRRAGAAVWFVLVAAAAGVLLVVGLRSHGSAHAAPEPQPAEHPPALTDNAPSNDLTPPPASAPAEAPSAPVAIETAAPSQPSPSPTPSTAGTANVKSAETAKPAEIEKPKADATPAVEKPVEAEKPAVPAAPIAPRPEPAEPGTEFDRSAAIAALKAAASEAAACRKDGDPSGTASLTITFAPSGRVTSAAIQGPPFAGTPTGGCIANAMRRAHVPAFSGDRVTVNKTIVVQ